MRIKERWSDFYCKVLYCFQPLGVILSSLIFMILVDIACAVLLFFVSAAMMHDVLLAILTGVTASVLVAVIIEMVNNYQRNSKRWVQLAHLFRELADYESRIAIETGSYDSPRAHMDFMEKLHAEMVREGVETQQEADEALASSREAWAEDEEDRWPRRDRTQCVFNSLSKLIPLVEDAYTNYSEVLRRRELESMAIILDSHKNIIHHVALHLMEQSTLLFGKDPKNPGDLLEWLPKRIKKDLNRGVLLHLAMEEWESQRQRIAEYLVRGGTLALEQVGIKISAVQTGDSLAEGNAYGDILSGFVDEIDKEFIALQRLVTGEPGFRTVQAYFKKNLARYRR